MSEIKLTYNELEQAILKHPIAKSEYKQASILLVRQVFEAQKLVNVDQPVMLNFADIKKEFEERFCFSYMENGEKLINDFMWKTSDNTMNVWEWFEQKLKEASKISA